MIEIRNEAERVILVGVSTSDQDDTYRSLEELRELADTAGAGGTEQRTDPSGDLYWKREDRRDQGSVVGAGGDRYYL